MDHPRRQAELRAALEQAAAVLRLGQAQSAERRLRAIQAMAPGEVNSLHLLGAALLDQGKIEPAIETLERTVQAAPQFARARTDLARAYRANGGFARARAELRRVLRHAPALDSAWLAYGDVLVDLGQYADARIAFERARQFDPHRAAIEKAAGALLAEDRLSAEAIFRGVLKLDASHVGALCGLAAVCLGGGRPADSERLIRHALKQSVHLPLAMRGLSQTLLQAGRLTDAESATRQLLKIEPENPQNWIVLASVCTRLLRQEDALVAYEEAARLLPESVGLRLSIGHIHKTLGRREECEKSYRQCLVMDPGSGEAYWSLADLKTYVFDDADMAHMTRLLSERPVDDRQRAQLHFALGRALEHRQRYADAFGHYARGNALRRATAAFDIKVFEAKSQRVQRCFDRSFFAQRAGSGTPDASPIFVVGLPRSGSTLVEQILATHSCVEGTMELPNVLTMVREFEHGGGTGDGYPETVRAAQPQVLSALGRRYLDETRAIRSGRARFIDKMPNNFSHIGLIQSILPRATVIDVRRHPMDSCFSTYKQYFAEGQSFSYGLDDLGRYFRCYLALMDHWDHVLPGKVMHLQYEELVREPEVWIRRLLAHCGLEFESSCLHFHATRRPVRTASSEQVRQPMYASGIGHWRHFAAELAPLAESLGDALDRFAGL